MILDQAGETAIVRFNGRLDEKAANEIKPALHDMSQSSIVFDFSKVDFIDSSGLGLIVSAFRRTQERDGNVALFGLTPQVRAIFELTRLHRIFDIFETESQALESLGS